MPEVSSESVASASAATASRSSSIRTVQEAPRPEAGPLPSKRGEIGYDEEIHARAASTTPEPEAALPERHPADRDAPPSVDAPSAPAASGSSTAAASSGPSEASNSTASLVKRKRKRDIFRFKDKKIPSYGGILLTTFLAFFFQCFVFSGTIIGWVVSIQMIMKTTGKYNTSDANTGVPSPSGSSSIFIHVVFGIAVLGQLLFLERRLFRLRAERYAFVHPGEMLPTSRHRRYSDPNIAYSPWNRPPLPTYAAALAQSGYGTGDVEDHIIAAPPPPAYGNTRGSTMLLAGFMRDSLRAQRPVSQRSQMSQANDRPLSYQSQDDQWQEIQDAERARRLEETLATLERPASRT